MKKLTSAVVTVVILCSMAAPAFSQEEDYAVVPVDLSIVPSLSTNGGATRKTTTMVEINIAVGHTDVLQGAGIGVVNLVGEDAQGAMIGVANYVGGDVLGIQSGVANTTRGSVQGVQSGVANTSFGLVHGAQTGVVNSAFGGVTGLQAGTANLNRGSVDGGQIGVANLTTAGVDGVQVGVVNMAQSTEGAQLGVINIAKEAKGLQAGIVNVSQKLDGVPIGLVSVILDGGVTRGQLWYDELGMVNTALVHGSPVVYNLYTVGLDQTQSWWTGGLGLGVHLGMGRSFLHMEGLYSILAEVDDPRDPVSLTRIRGYLGHHVTRRVALIAGGTLNYATSYNNTAPALPETLHGYEFPVSTSRHRFWPGAFAGIQF